MKAIILAAWEGTRLRPLTYKVPKAMVKVGWKSLLEHNLDRLLPYVDEYIIVVKYKQETVIESIWENYHDIPVRYHIQWEEKWTGAAIKWLSLQGNVVIAYADAIIAQQDVDMVIRCPHFAVLGKQVENPEKYGIFKIDNYWYIQQVIEKPIKYIGNLANFWFFKVDAIILDIIKDVQLSPRGEIEITDAINEFVKQEKMQCIELQYPITDVTTLIDLEKANKDYYKIPFNRENLYIGSVNDLDLYLWIQSNHFKDIVNYSLDISDTDLQNNTSDKIRFQDTSKVENWYKEKDRYCFCLLSKTWEFAGIIWYRKSLPPIILEKVKGEMTDTIYERTQDAHTGWIRIYWKFRWKGYAAMFLSEAEKVYKSIYPTGWLCVDVSTENIASQKSYLKAGFSHIWFWENQKTVGNETHRRMVFAKDFL